ncbi:MAG: hypothetical protein ACE5EX_02445 [Phycisphaerae bacterium]
MHRRLSQDRDHGLNFATGFDFVPGWQIDCNVNEIQDDCDIASGTSADADLDGVPDECQVDCNANGTYDRLDIYPFGASLDCNCNFVPDECDLASGSSTDCNANGTPDECEINFDCNGNATQDICEIFAGTVGDCNNNRIIDACEGGTQTVVLSADFEGGLPPGWTTTGIFDVTGNCSAVAACDGGSWAYAGDAGTCTYSDGQAGALVSPPVELPPGPAELRYCTTYNTEFNFDFADVVVNNVRLERLSGDQSFAWQNHTLDLTRFAGQTAQVIFRLQSDPGVSGMLGWLVDNIEIVSTNANPPSQCACVASTAPQPDVIQAKNRYLSFTPAATARRQAVRITYVDIPPPNSHLNGSTAWVGAPQLVSENGGSVAPIPGFSSFNGATLSCTPVYRNWGTMGTVHVSHGTIVPGGLYSIQLVDEVCDAGNELNFSAALNVRLSRWGDLTGAFDGGNGVWTAPDGIVEVITDCVGLLDNFAGRVSAPIKARADLEPGTPDRLINISDAVSCIDAFRGRAYPFDPGPPPCP